MNKRITGMAAISLALTATLGTCLPYAAAAASTTSTQPSAAQVKLVAELAKLGQDVPAWIRTKVLDALVATFSKLTREQAALDLALLLQHLPANLRNVIRTELMHATPHAQAAGSGPAWLVKYAKAAPSTVQPLGKVETAALKLLPGLGDTGNVPAWQQANEALDTDIIQNSMFEPNQVTALFEYLFAHLPDSVWVREAHDLENPGSGNLYWEMTWGQTHAMWGVASQFLPPAPAPKPLTIAQRAALAAAGVKAAAQTAALNARGYVTQQQTIDRLVATFETIPSMPTGPGSTSLMMSNIPNMWYDYQPATPTAWIGLQCVFPQANPADYAQLLGLVTKTPDAGITAGQVAQWILQWENKARNDPGAQPTFMQLLPTQNAFDLMQMYTFWHGTNIKSPSTPVTLHDLSEIQNNIVEISQGWRVVANNKIQFLMPLTYNGPLFEDMDAVSGQWIGREPVLERISKFKKVLPIWIKLQDEATATVNPNGTVTYENTSQSPYYLGALFSWINHNWVGTRYQTDVYGPNGPYLVSQKIDRNGNGVTLPEPRPSLPTANEILLYHPDGYIQNLPSYDVTSISEGSPLYVVMGITDGRLQWVRSGDYSNYIETGQETL